MSDDDNTPLDIAARFFPGCQVTCVGISIEVEFGDTFPAITSEQLAAISLGQPFVVSFRDDSRRYESCTITEYVLIISPAPACAAGSERGE